MLKGTILTPTWRKTKVFSKTLPSSKPLRFSVQRLLTISSINVSQSIRMISEEKKSISISETTTMIRTIKTATTKRAAVIIGETLMISILH